MASKIQLRRDTAANWTSSAAVLASGELGLETDTGKLKCGDGTTAWGSLAYYTLGTAGFAATSNNLSDLDNAATALTNLGVTASSAELNKLDALTRGSIVVGDASGATAELTKGTVDQVLTSDGTDIAWSDAASGGGTTYVPSPTTAAYCPSFYDGMTALGHTYRHSISAGYVFASRGYDSSASHPLTSNNFNIGMGFKSDGHNATATGFATIGLQVNPSTGACTWGAWEVVWQNTSVNGTFSTTHSMTCEGSKHKFFSGNVTYINQNSYESAYWGYSTLDTGQHVTHAGHATNGCYANGSEYPTIPFNSSGDTRCFSPGYGASKSPAYQGGYNLVYLDNSTTTPTPGGWVHPPSCNSSTNNVTSMFGQLGVYPDASDDFPVHMFHYQASAAYPANEFGENNVVLGLSYSGSVSSPIATGYMRERYYNRLGFVVVDGSSKYVIDIDDYGRPSKWTSYNVAPTLLDQTRVIVPVGTMAGRHRFMPTGVENEWMTWEEGSYVRYGYPTWEPGLVKFKINPTTGAVYDAYKTVVDSFTPGFDTMYTTGWETRWFAIYNASDQIDKVLMLTVKNYSDHQIGNGGIEAKVIDVPVAADWKALPGT